jgi:hypothetical protein
VLTAPRDLPDDLLASALDRGWGVAAAAVSYRPVGFGSHHWEVTGARGSRWFLTADELESKRRARDEPPDVTFARLRAATMLTPDGWMLVDWDTALLAPPERDVWPLDPGDGSLLRGYEEATGVAPRPSMLELYRVRWDLADLAVTASRFARPHDGSRDDQKSWDLLRALVARLAGAADGGRSSPPRSSRKRS